MKRIEKIIDGLDIYKFISKDCKQLYKLCFEIEEGCGNNNIDCNVCCKKLKEELLKACHEDVIEPYKVKLVEKELLLYYQKQEYEYVVRGNYCDVEFYKNIPYKLSNCWSNKEEEPICFQKSDLFRFIKWEDKKPTPIKNILNNCEVVEDD